jgi:hypothetical protein
MGTNEVEVASSFEQLHGILLDVRGEESDLMVLE